MSNELKPCWKCEIKPEEDSNFDQYACPQCWQKGPMGKDMKQAGALWNEQQSRTEGAVDPMAWMKTDRKENHE